MMNKYLLQFNRHLFQFDMMIRDVEADGNCLFRAIADQMTGDEDYYPYYRKMTVHQLKVSKLFFKDFLPEGHNMETYTNKMSQDGVWGGHLELQAMSDALQLDIVVHTVDGYYVIKHRSKTTCTQFICSKLGYKKQYRQIHVAYHSGDKIVNHYSSVRMINDDSYSPAKLSKNLFEASSADQSTIDETLVK